ncbi:MAG: TAXI family TRAP transporter solute-binding subunit, partial [bacterium]
EPLRGKQISIGTQGSGTRTLVLELLSRIGVDLQFAKFLAFTPQEAGEKLLRGEIDAAMMSTAWESPMLHRLLASKDIELESFRRADAYVALYPYLNKIVLPKGVGNMQENRPPEDTVLIAPKASLVVRAELHPAIQYLLLDAAEQIHSGQGIFQKAGQFPAAESVDLPLSDVTRQFYRSGQPFLQRHLPFWLSVMIRRLLVLLIPLLGVSYPLLRFLPLLYGWKMRRRIYKLYAELRLIEQERETRGAGQDTRDLRRQLDDLEERADHLSLPVSYVAMLYMLRDHIALVRRRLENPPI